MFSKQEKYAMTEAEIRSNYILPALKQAKWSARQIREEFYFTAGRYVFDRQTHQQIQQKQGKKADYLLSYQANLPLAIVEAKDNKHALRAGLQQAMDYAQILDIPFAYSSNGDGFIERDFLTGIERQLELDEFPTPEALWQRYLKEKAFTPEQLSIIQQPYYTDANKPIEPRYYQEIAINKTVEAVARGQKRILLVMATGTGKTYTAFQIIHRLKTVGAKRRILFLADRNILVDQPMREDFKPFQSVMTKVSNKTLDSAYEVYMALYQQLEGGQESELFKQFQPSFFDLIVIDECHRGSAKENSNWRAILDYFKDATHIGMTATPKETTDASNISYFGDPIYTYSLKQGIEDGFLAPYRVIRVGLDCDLMGWRPPKGFKDINGEQVEDKTYYGKDFDRTIISEERTELVAQRISEFLQKTDRLTKTIVFCVDINHANRMCTALAKFNADMLQQNPKYICQITGDQSGKHEDLEAFCEIKNEKYYPVIAVTSKLMTTGVNSRMCKLVVLDNNIQSMTEFKQIIGRGTRLCPNDGKTFFTIMDFRGVTELFADPAFDGEPTVIIDATGNNGNIPDGEIDPPTSSDDDEGSVKEPRPTYIIKKGIGSQIINEREQYLNEKGELVTEAFNDLSRKEVLESYQTFEAFRQALQKTPEKIPLDKHWLSLLKEANQLAPETNNLDLFAKVIYGEQTTQERINRLKSNGYFEQFDLPKRHILELLLEEHCRTGLDFTQNAILNTPQFQSLGGVAGIINRTFGGRATYQQVVKQLEQAMYTE